MSSATFSQSALSGWLDPSLLPAYGIFAVVTFFVGRYVDNKYIRPPSKTGFGKGAPGFMTNTRQIRVTPEIAARLRRGEQVSPEEITAAVEQAERNAQAAAAPVEEAEEEEVTPKAKKGKAKKAPAPKKKPVVVESEPEDPANEWIPEGHIKPKGGSQRRRQR